MKVNTDTFLQKSVTIINRSSGKDNGTGVDAFYKTVINDALWDRTTTRGMSGNDVLIGSSVRLQIPKKSSYRAPQEWKTAPNGKFTLQTGDFIILGTVTETITSSNFMTVVNAHKPDACTIQSVRDTTGDGMEFSTRGVSKYLQAYIVEGV